MEPLGRLSNSLSVVVKRHGRSGIVNVDDDDDQYLISQWRDLFPPDHQTHHQPQAGKLDNVRIMALSGLQ
jgi:hypothetical protein